MPRRNQDDTVVNLSFDKEASFTTVAPQQSISLKFPWSLTVAIRICFVLIVSLSATQLWLWSVTLQVNEGHAKKESDHDHLRFFTLEAPMAIEGLESTWTCTQDASLPKRDIEKSRQCVVQHACVDDDGLFLLTNSDPATHTHNFPIVQLMSAPDSGLSYWKPRFKYTTKGPMGGYYKNETVFAYGIFQPGHFSHFLYDGILPLYSTMKRFHGTNSSWLLRQATYVGENTMQQAVWEMDAITSGKELVLNAFEVVSSFQVLPPKSHPICFERAVIGLGSQCGFGYCATNTPVEVYKAYRDQIQEFYFATPTQWTSFHNNERRKHLAAKFSPSMCVEKARYYNFQHPSSGLEIEGEPQIRQGVRNPDSVVVDPSAAVATFPNASPSISPIVAIIERHGSRSVLNLDKVIERTVAQGFRVKVMTYDQGCGIPQVAYMMRDVNILISTHGNALGGSLWMPDKPWPLIISIETTKHHETWFMTTTTVLAQRFTIHCCGPQFSGSLDYESTCPFIRDVGLARVSLKGLNWQLDPEKEEQELELLTGAEYPLEMLDKYGGDKLHPFLSTYWKNLPRYADVDRLAGLLEKVWREIPQDADKSFLQICQEGRCCGPGCDGVMARNIVGPWRAYGQQLDSAHWGEHLAEGGWDGNGNNGNWNEASRSAQELKSWVV